MNIEIMLLGILFTSAFTGLTTEAVKTVLDEYGREYHANVLAGCVSVFVSLIVGAAYLVFTGTAFSLKMFMCLVCLILLSWLCAMVGYDKVIQTITQLGGKD